MICSGPTWGRVAVTADDVNHGVWCVGWPIQLLGVVIGVFLCDGGLAMVGERAGRDGVIQFVECGVSRGGR